MIPNSSSAFVYDRVLRVIPAMDWCPVWREMGITNIYPVEIIDVLGSDAPLCGGLMVSALDSGASATGSSPGQGHCVVFLGKTLYSHGASLHPGV